MAYQLDKEQFRNAFRSQAPGFRKTLMDQGFSGQDLRDRLQGLRRTSRTASRVQGRRPEANPTDVFGKAQDKVAKRGGLVKGWGFDATAAGGDKMRQAFQGFNPGILLLLKRLFGGG